MSAFVLRPYQTEAKHDTYCAWNSGIQNILVVKPTGAGKTVFVSDIFKEHKGAAVAIAHRQELVSQLSLALARQGVYHNLIASKKTVNFISHYHAIEVGKSFFHPQAPITCAGVDTLLRRDLGPWRHQVTLWMQDEAHHVLRNNKWGKAAALFPNARGLGVTATPCRADGDGLGRHADGLFDHMIVGPSMRDLIAWGNLTDYRVFAPPSDMDLSKVAVSKRTGDYNPNQLREASHKSHIVGDVVEHYLRIAAGKLGVTFAVDVETATEIAQRYNAVGVPAQVVSAKTPDSLRVDLISQFRRGELKQLVNVDLFGEGFDLPAIEVVSMARPTESYSLFAQQFGRALRPMEGKEHAIIIDHVGNIIRHGLPDSDRSWTLDRREKNSRGSRDDTIIPVTACTSCMSVYERHLAACPFCGTRPEPMGRARPEQVDGNLFEMSPEALNQLRAQISAVRETPENMKARLQAGGLAPVIVNSQVKLKRQHHEVLNVLTEQINWWGAIQIAKGDTREESYKRFFHRYGVDVLTAQTLKIKDAEELSMKIQDDLK